MCNLKDGFGDGRLKLLGPDPEHPIKLLLFGFDNFCYAVGGFDQFGISALHQVADGVDHFEEEWLLLAEQATVTNSPAEDLAQDVAAAFV